MTADDAQPARSHGPSGDWVPVERRWLGLDWRTIAPALVVLALGILIARAIPAIDSATPYDDEVLRGDVIGIEHGVRFVPPTGWDITEGRRVRDETRSGDFTESAAVEDGDTEFWITAAAFSGDANALLAQLEEIDEKRTDDRGRHTTGPARAVQTCSGIDGVRKRYSGTNTDGLLAAFVADGVGIRVVMTTRPGQLDGRRNQFDRMIASIRHKKERRAR
jgi:hypothetical protein